MKRFTYSILLAMVAGLVGFVGGPASAAATLVVDDDGMGTVASCNDSASAFPTITLAMATASNGDTIVVCPGTYNESLTVTKELTFLGPNAGVSALGARNTEAVVTSGGTTFLIQSPDVTVDGFTINGAFAVYIDIAAISNVAVENNIATGSSWALGLVSATGSSGYEVHDNILASPVRNWHLSGGAGHTYSDISATGNRFTGTGTIFFSGNVAIAGYEFSSNEVLNTSNNMSSRISNGDVSENFFSPSGTGSLALQINLHDSSLTDNAFDGNDTNACLQLFGVQFGLDPSTNVLVSDNTFTDCSGAALPNRRYALQLSQGVDQIDVTGNDFTNTKGDAINTRLSGWTLNEDIHINQNNITGSTDYGVNNTAIGVLDAECNWWGSATGPMHPSNPGGTGDRVSDNVDYRGWLNAPAPGGACISPPPNPEACKKDGWRAFTDDQGNPFKNQGDCQSYVATGGRNKGNG